MVYSFTDPPKVIIRMGKSLVASDIREGVDVYFDCVIRANPAPKTKIVTWLHDVSTYCLQLTYVSINLILIPAFIYDNRLSK